MSYSSRIPCLSLSLTLLIAPSFLTTSYISDRHTSMPAQSNLSLQDNHHDDVKWNYFPRYWPFVRGIHRSPVNSPDKGQWRGALVLSLICVWINDWVNNREAGDLRRYRAHYDVIVMMINCLGATLFSTTQASWKIIGKNALDQLTWWI